MTPDQMRKARDIFVEAIPLEGDSKSALIRERCAGDPDLLALVEQLLEGDQQAVKEKFMIPIGTTLTDEEPPILAPMTRIGPYRLLERIGEGGMGRVYKAERQDPYLLVALKLIKPGMDTTQVIARFEAERQALALMNHTNIAKVLDGGTTVYGLPYFVMELIKGEPITKYCDRNRLTPKERLELFVELCDAIQHAHNKGIIHRDIKPSNVLVTEQDGEPVLKVIDFGVAKALNQRLTEKTIFEYMGQAIGALEYMSPEQAEPTNLDITTQSDVFSLGVLLYELMTGSTPIGRERLKSAALREVVRIICEEEPPTPSTRLTQSKASLEEIAAHRRTDPDRLPSQLRGEIDWIVMKAIEKLPRDRYETAERFRDDIKRYLNKEAVDAAPRSRTYRFRKFAYKHRKAITTFGAFGAILVSAAVVSTWQALRAIAAEREALANFDLAYDAVEKMYDTVTEEVLLFEPKMLPLRNKLAGKATGFIDDLIRQHPNDLKLLEKAAKIHRSSASSFLRIGMFKESLAARLAAITYFSNLADAKPNDPTARGMKAQVLIDQAYCLSLEGRTQESIETFQKAILLVEPVDPAHPNDQLRPQTLARAQGLLADVLAETGAFTKAEQLYDSATELLIAYLDKDPVHTTNRRILVRCLVGRGTLSWRTGGEDPEPNFNRAMDHVVRLEKTFKEPRDIPVYRAMVLDARGDWLLSDPQRRKEAETVFNEAVGLMPDMLDKFRTMVEYQLEQANALIGRAAARLDLGAAVQPLPQDDLSNAKTILDTILKDHPDYPGARAKLSQLLGLQARLATAARDPGAKALFALAVDEWKRASEAQPANAHYQLALKKSQEDLSRAAAPR